MRLLIDGRRPMSPPVSSNDKLRGFALTLCFEGLVAANVNLDLLGFGFRLLGESDLQYPLVIVGVHLTRIHRARQRERPSEAAILPLNATEILLFLFLLDLALAMDGAGVALDRGRFLALRTDKT